MSKTSCSGTNQKTIVGLTSDGRIVIENAFIGRESRRYSFSKELIRHAVLSKRGHMVCIEWPGTYSTNIVMDGLVADEATSIYAYLTGIQAGVGG